MQKLIRNIGFVVFISLLVFNISTAHAGWSGAKKILQIQMTTTSDIFVWLNSPLGVGPCPNSKWLRYTKNTNNFREIYALILMAKAQQSDIVVYGEIGTCSYNDTHFINPYLAVKQ